ncbi:coenzyme F420-0:L-glutamate ligase [Limimaricola variabilis]|jgi:coenzyme F420-0:L-glutamate ligase/coenzyme F420-1:gamma-L-glutamate ligase|uniref:coenzyme F420-0:L-glutamate ligase n=1 Tax=Limimaricola variabilis TaxID=1492771 RepID=UPI002AC91301|nr:coenzyme F420-0:L-glutamate ligase [Limimaricola variabilis]WPY94390.1 coenzyme F420-0:L-glutamate ligase [Limimaricola variabilis]
MSLSVSLTAIPGIPDIRNGDDLAAIIGDRLDAADLGLRHGDILCVAQKIFSKAEGCIIPLDTVTPSEEALRYAEELNKDARKVEVVLRESTRVVRSFRRPDQNEGTMICEHRLGFISANAAVDESNFGEESAVMVLPPDPDASCAALREALKARFGAEIGVVMTDTFGRPWRLGQVNVAIGLSKVPATIREQGNTDAWGRPLQVTEPALADEIAAASGLVVRKDGKTPAVLLRGLDWTPAESRGADILRKKQEDMFR